MNEDEFQSKIDKIGAKIENLSLEGMNIALPFHFLDHQSKLRIVLLDILLLIKSIMGKDEHNLPSFNEKREIVLVNKANLKEKIDSIRESFSTLTQLMLEGKSMHDKNTIRLIVAGGQVQDKICELENYLESLVGES